MTEWAHSRGQIEQSQLERLQALLGVVRRSNPFYRAKLADVEIPERPRSLADCLAPIPFTTKEELIADQAAYPPYGTNLSYPLSDYTRCHQTSGSTGMPLRWLDTAESWQWMLENWRRVYQAAGVTAADRIFFAFSFGPFLGFWTAFESALQLGALCLPGGGLSSVARLRSIQDHEATVLCCTPTYAIHLAEVAGANAIELDTLSVRRLIVAGEPGGSLPAVRARIEDLWSGARVFDHHGMTEVGPVSFECPDRPGTLKVIESAYLPEVLDPGTLEPVPQGRTGELVLTTLGRMGSPLIRYRTGDLVKQADLSDSGSGASPDPSGLACRPWDFALEGGILGRADDMVVVRGVNLYPGAVEEILRRFDGIAEFQVTVDTSQPLTQVEIQVEPDPQVTDVEGLIGRLGSELQAALNLRIPVKPVSPNSLPRFELKANRWQKR